MSHHKRTSRCACGKGTRGVPLSSVVFQGNKFTGGVTRYPRFSAEPPVFFFSGVPTDAFLCQPYRRFLRSRFFHARRHLEVSSSGDDVSRPGRKPTHAATGEGRWVYELCGRGGGALLRARKKICITCAGNAAVPSARTDFVVPFVDSLRRRVLRRDWDNFLRQGRDHASRPAARAGIYVLLFRKFFLAVSSATTAEMREKKKKKKEKHTCAESSRLLVNRNRRGLAIYRR